MGPRKPTARASRRALAALACAVACAPAVATSEVTGAQAAAGGAAPAAPGAPELAQADHELDEIGSLLAAAYFRTALALVDATRGLLAGAGDEPEVRERRARLEVMAATAELAVGERRRARASMGRALDADPDLSLDEARTSPRVVALLREARGGVPAARVAP